ncbi:MAG TPA: protein-L-isoaspartate(D-aspartate) O-methyltransferase [bacterium]|nr:protein-L-isoaspartate(D-aspartate) O-methyltransferase [bacterium]
MRHDADNNVEMIEEQVLGRDVKDENVIEAMKSVDRAHFVDSRYQHLSYADRPLPIGHNQTISQPYIVGFMTEKLDIQKDHKVLEIGSGCGYQTAVLCKLAQKVFAIDIVSELIEKARKNLKQLDVDNYEFKCGNGRKGWQEKSPFDRILIAAASSDYPQDLIDQLKIGGKMIIPHGHGFGQNLVLITKTEQGIDKERILSVRFVPLVGE